MEERIIRIIKKYKKAKEATITQIIKRRNEEIIRNKEYFKKINIICENEKEYEEMKRKREEGIKIYNKRIEEIIKKKNQEIIYIIGEYMGEDEGEKEKKIYYNEKEISEIVNEYEKECEIMIIKVPRDYNFKNFKEKIKKKEIEIYGRGENKREYYILIET